MKGFEGLNLGQRPVLLAPRISLVEKVKGEKYLHLGRDRGTRNHPAYVDDLFSRPLEKPDS